MVVERGVVYAAWRTGNFAVVGRGVEVYDVEPVFEQVDAGDEGFALDAVFVEVVWMAVGGCD